MKARNPLVTERTKSQIRDLESLGWYHSIERPDGHVIPGLQTLEQLRRRLDLFELPRDLHGARVLDIGAWDGWFTFELEKRGATVVAVDATLSKNFLIAKELLGSHADYRVASVYDLSPHEYGQFDIVLFLGVLYHLKHPLLALERVCALTRGIACIESFVTDDGGNPDAKPELEFYESTELCGQFDNWVGPNTSCLMSFCRTAGFAEVDLRAVVDNRAHVQCSRLWSHRPSSGATDAPHAPYIILIENTVSHGVDFSPAADGYVSICFDSAEDALTVDRVYPEIGQYATRPVFVERVQERGWRAIVKLPPGLAKGWSPVRVSVEGSAPGNRVRIGIDVGREDWRERMSHEGDLDESLSIEVAADGKTWARNRILVAGANRSVSVWVRGLPEGASRSQTWLCLDGHDLPSVYVSEPDVEGLVQINALVPAGHPGGAADLAVVCADGRVSRPVPLEIIPA